MRLIWAALGMILLVAGCGPQRGQAVPSASESLAELPGAAAATIVPAPSRAQAAATMAPTPRSTFRPASPSPTRCVTPVKT